VVSLGVVYLLAVLLVSATWGVWLGLATAALSDTTGAICFSGYTINVHSATSTTAVATPPRRVGAGRGTAESRRGAPRLGSVKPRSGDRTINELYAYSELCRHSLPIQARCTDAT
jgi:hypothetical protein